MKPSLVMCSMIAFLGAPVKSASQAGGPAHAVASCLTLFETPAPCFSALCFGPCGASLSRPGGHLLSCPVLAIRPSSGHILSIRRPCSYGIVTAASAFSRAAESWDELLAQHVSAARFPFWIETAGGGSWPSPGSTHEAGPGVLMVQEDLGSVLFSWPSAAPGVFAFPHPSAPRGRFIDSSSIGHHRFFVVL